LGLAGTVQEAEGGVGMQLRIGQLGASGFSASGFGVAAAGHRGLRKHWRGAPDPSSRSNMRSIIALGAARCRPLCGHERGGRASIAAASRAGGSRMSGMEAPDTKERHEDVFPFALT